MMFHDHCDSLVDIRGLLIILAIRKIRQSGRNYLDLAARVSSEYRRQSAQSARDRIHRVTAHAMDDIHDLVDWTQLRLSELAVGRIHKRPNGLIINLVLGTKRQNCMIDEAGNVHA